jgi:hypothetical protein
MLKIGQESQSETDEKKNNLHRRHLQNVSHTQIYFYTIFKFLLKYSI